MTASSICCFRFTVCILLSLLVARIISQECNSQAYAADFDEGSTERWLYENVASGAECVSIARTQTEGVSNRFNFPLCPTCGTPLQYGMSDVSRYLNIQIVIYLLEGSQTRYK